MKTLHAYILGFNLSLALTLLAFALAGEHVRTAHEFPTHGTAVLALVALALLQLLVQLIFFLHLGQEQKPRWNLAFFAFALIVIGILVGGTLWIMYNLGHGQMPTREIFIDGEISPQTQND